ncbi:hypothetical protein RHGRI_002838 [Rhododendron griersonianum]|uniref:Uncharacterized protein n=3 Tax=Rhododendron TaxID=4346 RepID=A0AAV6LRS0_9ERIC|nr:hypothetical protein RHGRI_002838 [Rhododendron griersonianum]
MSCLNLGKRLQPAKKAWKMFTSKLNRRLRLHKLNRSNSKTIKKPKNRIKTTRKSVPWLTLAFKPRTLQCKRTTIKATRNLYCHHLPKKSAPVYIDEFFKEPQMSSLKNHLQPPATAATTKESEEGREERGTGADDMWESLGLASPLMQGINERAEEFITRIRAEMQLQEMIARRL